MDDRKDPNPATTKPGGGGPTNLSGTSGGRPEPVGSGQSKPASDTTGEMEDAGGGRKTGKESRSDASKSSGTSSTCDDAPGAA